MGASVIFVSSIAAGAYSAGWGTYAMTKNGLNAFMHCLADEVGGDGVRVNSISPGWVETKMAQDAHRGLADHLGVAYEDHYAANMRANMLGVLVTTDSIADMAVFPRERARPPHHGAGTLGLRRLPPRQQRELARGRGGRIGADQVSPCGYRAHPLDRKRCIGYEGRSERDTYPLRT